MRSGCRTPRSSVTTGVGAAPASSRLYGRNACAVWSPPMATRFKISPPRQCQRRRSRSTGFGINIISIPSAGAPGCRPTGTSSASCCGICGRRTGSSTTQHMIARRDPSTIPISSMWSSNPTATVTATRRAILRWSLWKNFSPHSPKFGCRQSCCKARATASTPPEHPIVPQEAPAVVAATIIELLKA